MSTLTAARLREVLSYNRRTGMLRWKVSITNVVRPGDIAGRISGGGHRQIQIDGRRYYAHQLAHLWVNGSLPTHKIDHNRNGDPDDNRWRNLRKASSSENARNRRRPSTNRSGYKGVHRLPNGRWRSCIYIRDGKGKRQRIHLGCFGTRTEAHFVYMTAARKHFGEFACDGTRRDRKLRTGIICSVKGVIKINSTELARRITKPIFGRRPISDDNRRFAAQMASIAGEFLESRWRAWQKI